MVLRSIFVVWFLFKLKKNDYLEYYILLPLNVKIKKI